jgi:hypothetical protein
MGAGDGSGRALTKPVKARRKSAEVPPNYLVAVTGSIRC